jgi:uncharacterized protein involved in exopolysaccharide biosynthesis/Mrp family chromosome partitioning ATPase
MTIHSALLAGPPVDEAFDQRSFAPSHPIQQLTLRQIWYILRRHRLLLSLLVGLTVTVVLISQLLADPIYRAVATVQVELTDGSGANQAEIAARNQQRVVNEARIYRSLALAEQVVRDLDLTQDPRFMDPGAAGSPRAADYAASKLVSMTNVSSSNDSDFIDIAVESRSPRLSAKIANQFIASLQKLRINRRNARKENVVSALDAEQRRLADEAVAAERAVAAFRSRQQMLVGAGGAEDYSQLNRIAVEAASASAMRAASSARAAGVTSAVRNYSLSGATSALLQQQQKQHDDLMRQRSELAVSYGARHPEMQRVDAQLAEIRTNMKREQDNVAAAEAARASADAAREQGLARAEAAAAGARAGQLEGQLRALTGKAFSNTTNAVELAALERRAEVSRQAFLITAQKAQEVRSELETTGVNSSLVSSAAIPDSPVSPAPKRAALVGLFGSLMLGLLLVFTIEMFDNKLRSSDQIRRLFGLHTFAMLPEVASASNITAEDNPLIDDPQSLFSEVARTLGAEVADIAVAGQPQTVLVTSPLPGDGKSTVALTLAAAAASMGRRAIVVDLDLRRPTPNLLRTLQNKLNAPDLVDYLTGGAELKKLLPPAPSPETPREATSYKPVVLSTRKPVRNPASLIRAPQLRGLFGDLRERYDLIVINAPATLAVRDARTLIEVADSTLMVVRWGQTTIEQMRASMDLLRNKVHGVVFNKVDYAEHARRGYADAVQFYVDSADYYSGPIPGSRSWIDKLRDLARGGRGQQAA